MNEQEILLAFGGIGVAALGCQWLAWRLKLPAILFLLLSGIMAGPILGWLDPQEMFGPLLMPLVSLAVALILFEGSLTLHLSQWREIGTVVRRMVTLGALSTWVVISAATHWLLGFDWLLAILFGTLTLVTGPTVIVPMLRVVRPKAAVANILRWEGIVIDPIGALLAVVVYSFIIASAAGDGLSQSLLTFAGVILCGSAFGVAGGWLLGQVIRHQWLPEYLHNLASLAAVLGIFIASNQVMHESGLLAVTLMGMWLANMKGVDVRQILHFKENLSVLLISGLFILLAARLDLNALLGLGPAVLALLLVIQLIARPLNVALSTWGSQLNWRERALLAWIAPRGIVAAAVSAIFAIRLDEAGHAGALLLVPLTFAVIIGTVVLQSATARPLARLLKVAEPAPSGFLIVGANAPARALGTALQQLGSRVLLADSSWENIRAARMEGLPTYFGHPASQHADAHLDLVGLGHLLGLSPAGELNTLACTRFRHDFGHQRLFVLASGLERQRSDKHRASDEHRGRLFGSQALTYVQLANLFNQGAELYTTHLTEAFGWADYQALHGDRATLLFARDASGWVYVVGPDTALKPGPGWTLVALVQPQAG
ncbi:MULTISPECIES: sodium:proton antiporter [Pseudomonas]|jgi:NhaP-type Na+/H+ or K+/H+ antiporter|uniref:Sodium/proton antiporter (CPA1 family) n=1 Tax=Pseudomonas putida TaxID=303 RepID=A0A9X8EHM6_PSEPU|nr:MULTISPECIES: sodium:proton antiporter [Pseudomonas]MBG8558531.1 sodium:proton antiporter [Pseudomonas qingdaonensis]MCO7505332.1 sodium:proton antiporter [Pseudomonas sp. VE 267-6A]MCO7528800.1 sodium:proton antiporter [Pseudomonas sp. 2]MCQ0166340.1 sodium:proton antiporter [Pseudomonas sp. S12(2018)]OOW04389.1 sodium:proton antiporter [Pseudomonas sp. MF6396]